MTQELHITIYGSKTCAPCSMVKRYLDGKNIPYTYKDVELDPEALKEMLYHSDNQMIKPVIVVKDKGTIVGGNIPRLAELIK